MAKEFRYPDPPAPGEINSETFDTEEERAAGLVAKIPDSGARRKFETGSVRDIRVGKGRFDLMSPIAILRYAKHMEAGAVKYGDRNWEKGQPLMSYIDSASRHINDWMMNRLLGIEDAEDHLAAALWNIASFMHTQKLIECGHIPAELDDVPGPVISGS